MGAETTGLTARLLILLMVANGMPILLRKLLGERFGWPVDGGCRFPDGRPWFGPSKTWRGLVCGIGAAAAAAPLLGQPWQLGALVGAASLAGDLLSSFLKRRLGIVPSGMALGLDQIPESLLPLLAVQGRFGLEWSYIAWFVIVFIVLELTLSAVLYRFRIRNRPY
ncbi:MULTISPECIES: CDP-archaeol synthase [Methylococcus]|uniref:CDP-archaeol synthase n=1 Tax=Methylococcus capsulatus TaxID=414 RepID=A0ABZ2F7Q6_METCP|nr:MULTISPECIES: CDP-archaeol synthase [Methylococcus]MDF9392717.1 CDP-archaeol synthase [Methylococcus capsulatus]